MAPTGESEYAGQPVQEPDCTTLYVFRLHAEHALDPAAANLPASHHEHAMYDAAPSCIEKLPFWQGWHVSALVLPSDSENVPIPHRVHAETAVTFDHAPLWQGVHAPAIASEKVPVAQASHTDAPANA